MTTEHSLLLPSEMKRWLAHRSVWFAVGFVMLAACFPYHQVTDTWGQDLESASRVQIDKVYRVTSYNPLGGRRIMEFQRRGDERFLLYEAENFSGCAPLLPSTFEHDARRLSERCWRELERRLEVAGFWSEHATLPDEVRARRNGAFDNTWLTVEALTERGYRERRFPDSLRPSDAAPIDAVVSFARRAASGEEPACASPGKLSSDQGLVPVE